MNTTSPTPWHTGNGGTYVYGTGPNLVASCRPNMGIPEGEALANAALIVSAVNSHASQSARIAELEAALRDLLEGDGLLSQRRERARALLAKVGG